MTAIVDEGLFPGNYEDYINDDVAKQREIDLLGDNIESLKFYTDHSFPADGRSLYFDPLNPPKGSIPQSSVNWKRICTGDIIDCNEPVVFCGNSKSTEIEQGALGNAHFVNSVRLLACQPEYIARLIVSSANARYGIYTFKFYKAGSWRYVHIDDKIPCRQSGKVNFCRNSGNLNETFAMLLEKAYAKLHGCYEATSYGVPHKTMSDMTPAAYVGILKSERYIRSELCNDIWDTLESHLCGDSEANNDNFNKSSDVNARMNKGKKLIGCYRQLSDAEGEEVSDRKGISLGHMYQVVDVAITTAEATEHLNALTVGMVCVRNLQHHHVKTSMNKSTTSELLGMGGGRRHRTKDSTNNHLAIGRWTGRWSYGHPLWLEYPSIGEELRARTISLIKQRGKKKKQRGLPMEEGSLEGTDSFVDESLLQEGGDPPGGDKGELGDDEDDIQSNLEEDVPVTEEEGGGDVPAVVDGHGSGSVARGAEEPGGGDKSVTSEETHQSVLPSEMQLDENGEATASGHPSHHDSDEDEDEDIGDLIPAGGSHGVKILQPPGGADLMWLQIEDFVQVFNRVLVCSDLSFHIKYENRKFVSRWIPGDGVVGSGGPPFLFPSTQIVRKKGVGVPGHSEQVAASPPAATTAVPHHNHQNHHQNMVNEEGASYGRDMEYLDHDKDGNDYELPKELTTQADQPYDEDDDDEEEEENEEDEEEGGGKKKKGAGGRRQGGVGVTEDMLDTAEIDELEQALKQHASSHNKGGGGAFEYNASASGLQEAQNGMYNNSTGRVDTLGGGDVLQNHSKAGGGGRTQVDTVYHNPPVAPTGEGADDEGVAVTPANVVGVNGIIPNQTAFLNNPMYSISVNDYTTFHLSLYQADRRWSVFRTSPPTADAVTPGAASTITSASFANRNNRLASCMQYPIAVGFVIIKLTGMHSRLYNYRHRKVVAGSEFVEYSHISNGCVSLRPGRYAIVPYTQEVLDRSMGYVLHAQYIGGMVDFENENLIEERPEDNSDSEDEVDTDSEEHVLRVRRSADIFKTLNNKQIHQYQGSEDEDDEEEDDDDFDDHEVVEEEEEDEETKQKRRLLIAAAKTDERIFPPTLLYTPPSVLPPPCISSAACIASSSDWDWEWVEDSSAEAFQGMFEEVGELCDLINHLRRELRDIRSLAKTSNSSSSSSSSRYSHKRFDNTSDVDGESSILSEKRRTSPRAGSGNVTGRKTPPVGSVKSSGSRSHDGGETVFHSRHSHPLQEGSTVTIGTTMSDPSSHRE